MSNDKIVKWERLLLASTVTKFNHLIYGCKFNFWLPINVYLILSYLKYRTLSDYIGSHVTGNEKKIDKIATNNHHSHGPGNHRECLEMPRMYSTRVTSKLDVVIFPDYHAWSLQPWVEPEDSGADEDKERCPKHTFSIYVQRKAGFYLGNLFPLMVSAPSVYILAEYPTDNRFVAVTFISCFIWCSIWI